jgi:MYXO-CTERM domain-containing protein
VDFATTDGTAQAGVDYVAASGTLSWADGDTAPKAINIQRLNNPNAGAARTLSASLLNPQYGSLGSITTATITLEALSGSTDGGTGGPPDAGPGSDGGLGGDTDPGGTAAEPTGCACRAGPNSRSGSTEAIAATLMMLGLASRRARVGRERLRAQERAAPSHSEARI